MRARSPTPRQTGYILVVMCILVTATMLSLMHTMDSTTLRLQSTSRTAEALREAKEALIAAALIKKDPDPPYVPKAGVLPCPENIGWIGTASEGGELGTCSNTSSSLGRLPWRSLKLSKNQDGTGEQFWYVVSPGFRDAPINSNSVGRLLLDGKPVAAIVFAPGIPLGDQHREAATPGHAPVASDYLDGQNGLGNGNLSFTTTGSATNDIAIGITVSELMNPLVKRVLREIAGSTPSSGIRGYIAANGVSPSNLSAAIVPPYIDDATASWLSNNGWLSLISYTGATATQSARLSLGAQTLVVQTCSPQPCP